MTDQPGYRPDRIVRGMSLLRRIAVVAVGLAGLTGAVLLASLWATEPRPLPAATRAVFAGLMLTGFAWAGFAGWALLRRPLFAADRVIGGRLAVVVTTATTVATLLTAGPAAAWPGLLLTVAAVVLLVRARRYRARLLSRAAALDGR